MRGPGEDPDPDHKGTTTLPSGTWWEGDRRGTRGGRKTGVKEKGGKLRWSSGPSPGVGTGEES